MYNYLLKGSLVMVFSILFSSLFGQIWFKLELMDDWETYQVSLISDEDWTLPNNITSTGQVTIKAPTLEFEIKDFESVFPALTWKYNSRLNAPKEATDYDYFSFGLETASRDFDYEAGEEIPIIKFKNAKGCSDFVSLIDNANDPFIFSTTKKVNVGNQLTVVGARGNAYVGNKGELVVLCKKQMKSKDQYIENFVLFPNPAFNEVNITLDWTTKEQVGQFFIRDNAGRAVVEQQHKLKKGFNEITFDIDALSGGIYHIELTKSKRESISLDRFVKVYSASIDNIGSKDDQEHTPLKKGNK